ncbi:MAG: carboxypeptidase-like regulatory domain-containing protein, partial [Bryobacteraceae bacterium]
MNSPTRLIKQIVYFVFLAAFVLRAPIHAQDVLGGITGFVKDATGAAVPDATVRVRNLGTNLEVVQHTQGNGSYTVPNIPVGNYQVTFKKEGFETETHT